MRSFNDWYFDLFESGNGACLNQQEIAEEAWDYQQSKVDELQKRVDDLTELNRLKTIALQQSVNRTSPYVHEKIVALEQALKSGES